MDLAGADLVVGTSAGSVVGARRATGEDLGEMYARQLEPATGERAFRLNRATLAQFGWAMLRSRGRDVEFRRRIGALALAAEKTGLIPSEQERLDVFHAILGGRDWPDRALTITAVDAETGEFRPSTGPPVCRSSLPWPRAARCPASTRRSPSAAAATSTAGCVRRPMPTWPTATTGWWCSRPIPRGFGPMASVDAQVTGMVSRVAVVSPDAASRTAIGKNVLDPAAAGALGAGREGAGGLGRGAGRRGLEQLTRAGSAAQAGVAGADDRLRRGRRPAAW